MTNRIALRDLQLRLAQRLETAEAQPSAGWLAVEAADRGFLLPLVQSGEIFAWSPVQKVPYTQDWFSGVVNLRGGLYGVVDLYQFLYAKPAPGRTELSLRQSRFIAFNPALDINCVLLVDRLSGLKGVQDFAGKGQDEEQALRPPFFGANLMDAQGRSWQEIDLQRLVEDEHFLKVASNTEAA